MGGLLLIAIALVLAFRDATRHFRTPALEGTADASLSLDPAFGNARPQSSNAEALAAYQSGMQAVRDASLITAAGAFQRAGELDATMASAHLRAALYGDTVPGIDLRASVQQATALRASLSERDRGLLNVLEPIYLAPTRDEIEARHRMDSLVSKYPGDAEVQFVAALLFMNERAPDDVLRSCERVLEIDPAFASAWWVKAIIELTSNDPSAALRSVDRCLVVSSVAASCLRVRALLEDKQGHCEALAADAQRMIAVENPSWRAHDFLARALFARGRPIDAVREALEHKWSSMPPAAHDQMRLYDELHLAEAHGDFVSAVRFARDYEQLGPPRGAERIRSDAVLAQIDLQTEIGDLNTAAKIADAYLRRVEGAPITDTLDTEPWPVLYAAAVRGGLRTRAERDAHFAQWLHKWTQRAAPSERGLVWLAGYATPAQTTEEAKRAAMRCPNTRRSVISCSQYGPRRCSRRCTRLLGVFTKRCPFCAP